MIVLFKSGDIITDQENNQSIEQNKWFSENTAKQKKI